MPDKDERDDEAESEDEDEDMEADFLKHAASMKVSKTRTSVSAEAYGQWNQKQAFEAPVFPKSREQLDQLRDILSRSFLFSALGDQEFEVVLMALEQKAYGPGESVILEGDDGDCLYIVEQGTLVCLKLIDGENKPVKTCQRGDIFGELALLYNCPRAASVVSQDASLCWRLDREPFNHIVKEAAAARRSRYEGFLKSVELLSSMGDYERSQVADALKNETFQCGDVIVKQDETGDRFYIVEEGTLSASINGEHMMDYGVGDYFGELSLLEHQPRAASVVVVSPSAKLVSLGQTSFNNMLGPLQALLTQRGKAYRTSVTSQSLNCP